MVSSSSSPPFGIFFCNTTFSLVSSSLQEFRKYVDRNCCFCSCEGSCSPAWLDQVGMNLCARFFFSWQPFSPSRILKLIPLPVCYSLALDTTFRLSLVIALSSVVSPRAVHHPSARWAFPMLGSTKYLSRIQLLSFIHKSYISWFNKCRTRHWDFVWFHQC